MPVQEFWNEDPDLLWVYRNLFLSKIEQEVKIKKEMINFQSYLTGFYNYYAIGSALSKNEKYLEKPIDLEARPKTKQEIAQKIKERAMKGKEILQQRRETKG